LPESLWVLWPCAVVASGTLLQGYSDPLGFVFFFSQFCDVAPLAIIDKQI
jgi:hypothetical protein